MANPNDEVRDAILRHLYAVHEKGKSPRSAGLGIRDLQRALKTGQGYKQQAVASNLDYLVQKGWVTEDVESRTFLTERGTQQAAPKVTYKVSAVGIDLLEGGASMYRRDEHLSRINITNVAGVTVVGDGNVVNAKMSDLSAVLSNLEDAVVRSDELSDEDRLAVVSDTIQAQLQKPDPDIGVIRTIWGGIEKVVTAGEAVRVRDPGHFGTLCELFVPLSSHVETCVRPGQGPNRQPAKDPAGASPSVASVQCPDPRASNPWWPLLRSSSGVLQL